MPYQGLIVTIKKRPDCFQARTLAHRTTEMKARPLSPLSTDSAHHPFAADQTGKTDLNTSFGDRLGDDRLEVRIAAVPRPSPGISSSTHHNADEG